MKRPRIKPELNTLDRSLIATGNILILAVWIFVLLTFSGLPESIPIHFNASGQVDGFGSRMLIFILPLLSSILFAGLTILNRHPHVFNYPVRVTAQNALLLYKHASRMIRVLAVVIATVFLNTAIGCVFIARGYIDKLPIWLFPVELILPYSVIIYFMYKLTKSAK